MIRSRATFPDADDYFHVRIKTAEEPRIKHAREYAKRKMRLRWSQKANGQVQRLLSHLMQMALPRHRSET